MNIVVFGTGYIYRKYRFLLNKASVNVIGLIDNDLKKQGTIIDGISVDNPMNINKYDYDYVFIMSIYVKEMTEQLISLGVESKCIVQEATFIQYKKFLYKKVFKCNNSQRILLLSHVVNLSGAPIALFRMASILKENGYDVTVATKVTEDIENLLYRYLERKISVEVYADWKQLDVENIEKQYNVVIVNTIDLYSFSVTFSTLKIPILWWLHESDDFYKNIKRNNDFSFLKGENTFIYSVGDRARQACEKHTGYMVDGNLLYGIPYLVSNENKIKSKKVRFALIGYFCELKAQHILMQVIREKNNMWQDIAEFWFVGFVDEKTKKMYEKYPNVYCTGVIDNEKMMEIYNNIDVLLCPSLSDTMPIVVTEAMMNKVLCVVSDKVGQVSYIQPYVNGLVCKAGDSYELGELIQWIIEHIDAGKSMGECGFSIYENNFSMETFEKNVLKIVEDCLRL